MPKTVAVLTTFFEATSGYSLITVAHEHIRAMLRRGYEPIVIVQENFQESKGWTPYQFDLRKILPAVPLTSTVTPRFEDDSEKIEAALAPVLAEVDVVTTHDIFFQEWYLPHNHACRRIAEANPHLLWLNWAHSRPHAPPDDADEYPQNGRYTPPPGYLVYPNSSDVSQLAQMYRIEEQRIRVARHMLDPLDIVNANDLTRTLYEAAGFGDRDIVMLYPCRLDRSKQPEKVLRLAAAFEHAGIPTSFLLIDWQSVGQGFQDYIDELTALAAKLDFQDGFHVASRIDGRCKHGATRQTVLQLMHLCDLFVLPSRSETYSLIAHEAMLCGNLVVLNEDLLPMPELFNGFARYAPFSAHDTDRQYWRRTPDGHKVEDEQAFWKDRALEILAEIRSNRVLFARSVARTQWNPDRIFCQEIEPLFHLDPHP